jgi:translation initiation factor IF-2
MTAYLQRMAASAIKPGGSVRPVAGTVFSPSRYRASREPAVVDEDILSARPGEMDARPGSAPRPEARRAAPLPGALRSPPEAGPGSRPAPAAPLEADARGPAALRTQGRAPSGAHREADRGPAAGPGSGHAPGPGLAAGRAGEAAGRAGEAGGHGPGERPAALARDGARGREPDAVAGKEGGAARIPRSGSGPGERPFAPVVAVDFRTQAASGRSPAGPAVSPGPGAGRGPGRDGGAPAAPRDPGEINIHIGRIEVTASAPPALRPAAPKAHRKAPSLEEYLRRRGGRTP